MIHDWAFTDSHYVLLGNRIKLDIPGKLCYSLLTDLLKLPLHFFLLTVVYSSGSSSSFLLFLKIRGSSCMLLFLLLSFRKERLPMGFF